MATSQTPGADERAGAVGVLRSSHDRRGFIKWTGATAAAAMLAACDRSLTDPVATTNLTPNATAGSTDPVTIDLGTDVGILNFAYALEQLEAAFYIQVHATMYSGVTSEERDILLDIKNHEVIHREFFAAALGNGAIPTLRVDFSGVNFDSREQVLMAAAAFEDTGVGAYNGAAPYIRDTDYLLEAGKIVSVEARHASTVRDLLGKSFAPDAFEKALTFEQVLARVAPFVVTPLAVTHSPTAHQVAALNARENSYS